MLVPPTIEEIATFRNEGAFANEEQAYVTAVAQQATDAVWVYTGFDETPTDQRAARILKNAIIQLTLWLMSQDEHRDQINSPFNSERIGSYSYSKLQQAAKGEETGIFWLDLLFKMVNSGQDSGMYAWSSSENVFNPDGLTYEESEMVRRNEQVLPDWYGR